MAIFTITAISMICEFNMSFDLTACKKIPPNFGGVMPLFLDQISVNLGMSGCCESQKPFVSLSGLESFSGFNSLTAPHLIWSISLRPYHILKSLLP